MNAQEQTRLDRVVQGVMGPVLKDYSKGVLTREDVDKRARRLLNSIQAEYRASAPTASLLCAGCMCDMLSADAAVIAGLCYCKRCAPKHRRAPPPAFAS